ncbi:MAG: tetratricopeptide repeat protein [Gammaproteobacteria bacterium]|nr:tetratricopeptide repeat protein [Gammaproteobacteria bacterium]
MLKCTAVAGFLVFILALTACGGADDRKAAYMKKGQDLISAADYEKARVEFKNVLQIDPKDVAAQFSLAQTLEKLQDWRGAAGSYLAVIEADPINKEALSKMGQIYLLSRNVEEAKKLADKLIALDAKDPDGLTLQASIKAINKDVDGALADARAALDAKPGHLNASALLASLYLQTGKSDESIATLKAALEASPNNSTVQAILARVYAQLGKHEEAAELFAAIVKQEPKVLGHRLRLAQYHLARKDLDKTEAALKEAVAEITADPKEATTAKLAYIEFLGQHRGADQAITTLEKMLAADKTNVDLRAALGKVYEVANKPEKARAIYQSIVDRAEDKKGPQALSAKTRIAVVAARQGDKGEAKKVVAEVLQDNPRDRDALVLRATLALDAGDPAAAIADYRAALKDDANSPETNRLLAKAHIANKEPALAIDTLKKAADANPQDITIRGDLANLYSTQKDLDSAKAQLDEILKVDPANVPTYEAMFKLHAFKKDWVQAHAVAKRLKIAHPNEPTGFYFDGLAYQGENKLPESLEQFESALAVSPDAVQPLSQLIKSHLAMRKPEVAEKRLIEVIEQNSKNFVAHNLLGELQLASKRYPEAQKSFESALATNNKWAVLYRNLAATQLAIGESDKAIATMEKGIEATKGAALLVTGLATYLENSGKLDEAIAQYERVLKENPKSDLAANNLAMLLIEYKDDAASKKHAQELSAGLTELGQPAYLDTVGWVAYKTGNFQKAADALEKATQGAPDAQIIRFHLGMAYLALGNEVLAKDNLKQAVDGAADYRGAEEAKAALAKLDAAK